MRKRLENALKKAQSRIVEWINTQGKPSEYSGVNEEYKILDNIAQKVCEYGLEGPTIITLETVKPLSFVGFHLLRFYLEPFLSLFGIPTKSFAIFENRRNVEKLIELIQKKRKGLLNNTESSQDLDEVTDR